MRRIRAKCAVNDHRARPPTPSSSLNCRKQERTMDDGWGKDGKGKHSRQPAVAYSCSNVRVTCHTNTRVLVLYQQRGPGAKHKLAVELRSKLSSSGELVDECDRPCLGSGSVLCEGLLLLILGLCLMGPGRVCIGGNL